MLTPRLMVEQTRCKPAHLTKAARPHSHLGLAVINAARTKAMVAQPGLSVTHMSFIDR
jgi:hypothetical protein